MRDAGVIYEDKEVVVDGNLVTSRQPSDLPTFLREIIGILKQRHRNKLLNSAGIIPSMPFFQ